MKKEQNKLGKPKLEKPSRQRGEYTIDDVTRDKHRAWLEFSEEKRRMT